MFRDCQYYCSYAQQTMIDSDWTDIGVPTFVLVRPNTNLEALNNKLRTLIPTRSGGKAKTEEFPLPRQPSRTAWPIHRRPRIRRIDHDHAGFHTHCDLCHPDRLHQLYEPIHRVQPASGKGGWDPQSNGRAANEPPLSVPWRILADCCFRRNNRPALCPVALPAFDRFTQSPLRVDYHNPRFWLAFIGFIGITGILAGSYPAFILSSFKPVSVLKGRMDNLLSTVIARKILVVFQFSTAIVLIISTLIVSRQSNMPGPDRPATTATISSIFSLTIRERQNRTCSGTNCFPPGQPPS